MRSLVSAAAQAACGTLLIALAASGASAQTAAAPQPEAAATLQSGGRITLFPSSDLFGVYVADPDRPTNTISFRFYDQNVIPETRTPRAALGAGGRFGILRINSARAGGRSWQVNIDAGLDALFDMQNREDAIGWDGSYGMSITTASGGPFAFKFGIVHTSGHIGDEYEERTGAARVNYTRQEVALGVSRRFGTAWRLYGETGIAYYTGGPDLKPYRLEMGAEFESRRRLFRDSFSWYGAGDFSLWEERDWRLDTSIQGGIVTRSEGRAYRFGMAFNDGRPPVSEFFRFTEASMTFGFWIDF
jgi:hypothetical protein